MDRDGGDEAGNRVELTSPSPPTAPGRAMALPTPAELEQMRRRRRTGFLASLVALGVALVLLGFDPAPVVVAVVVSGLLLRVGFLMLGMFARPVPEAPPTGELRKVKIAFRCAVCGAEVRMTAAPDEDPDPPRHCMQEMDVLAPID